MFSAPAVTIHGLAHARAALRPGLPVLLLSAPGAGLYAGCGWWAALIAAARAEFPGDWSDVLDCADAPGVAMAALRVGLKALVLADDCPAFPAVAAAATVCGAIVLPQRPVSLDLADSGGAWRLAGWLRRDIPPRLR